MYQITFPLGCQCRIDKLLMVNRIDTVIKASDNQYVQQLENVYVNEIIPIALEKAKDDASHNIPSPEAKNFIQSNFLTTRFNREVINYKSSSQNSQQQFHMNEEIKIFKRQKTRLLEKVKKVKNDLRIKERAIENLKSYRERIAQYNKVFPGILGLCTGEALFSATSLQLLMPNMLLSLLVGCVFGVALYFSALIGCNVLRRTNTRIQFIGALVLILSIVGGIFLTLGDFRLEYLKVMSNGKTGFELSAFQFMAIQLFMFTCALFLKYNYLPLKSEIEKYQQWKNAKKGIQKDIAQKNDLENTLETLEQNLSTSLITRRTLISSSKDVELKIKAMYEDAYQVYVSKNIHFRSDSMIPICFEDNQGLPPLTLYFQDDSLLEFNNADMNDEI